MEICNSAKPLRPILNSIFKKTRWKIEVRTPSTLKWYHRKLAEIVVKMESALINQIKMPSCYSKLSTVIQTSFDFMVFIVLHLISFQQIRCTLNKIKISISGDWWKSSWSLKSSSYFRFHRPLHSGLVTLSCPPSSYTTQHWKDSKAETCLVCCASLTAELSDHDAPDIQLHDIIMSYSWSLLVFHWIQNVSDDESFEWNWDDR